MFEWHFTVRGPADTEFSEGKYHGRITLSPEYPMKPPSIILLTVCISLFLYLFSHSALENHNEIFTLDILISWLLIFADFVNFGGFCEDKAIPAKFFSDTFVKINTKEEFPKSSLQKLSLFLGFF